MATLSSCGSEKSVRNNPLLDTSWDTPYGTPPFDQIDAADYMPALELAIEEQNNIIASIVSDSTELNFEEVILALDNSDIKIKDVFNIFTMVEAANSTPEMAEVNMKMMPRLSAQQSEVLLNAELFAKVKGVYNIRTTLKLDHDQLRLTERIYNDFVRGGALLDDLAKRRLAIINDEIAELQVEFSQHLLAENNDYLLVLNNKQIEGLSYAFRLAARKEAENRGLETGWAITLQPSSWIPFMTYSENRELREELYKAYLNRGVNGNDNDNREIISKVIKLRQEKARLLGYNNYSEYVTADQMASTPSAAYELLDEIWQPSLELAQKEQAKMEELLHKDIDTAARFESWDWWYYAEKIRERDYSLKEDVLKLYFSVDGVRNGAFLLANRLYGLTFRPVLIPQYADDCSAYEVVDVDGKSLGVLHLDLYARPTKGQGAWCGFIREQRYENGERVAPVVSISCNFAKPMSEGKTLLTMNEVETLFHEFGHALHFLFQDVKYRGLSDVEGDFVELPSQIVENWAFEPEMLRLYALNYRTGEVITEDLIEKVTKSRLFNQGFMTVELAAATLLDLDLHTLTDLDNFDVESFERESLIQKRGLIPQIEPRYHLSYFSHLFTFEYASGYYFYLWAEVLDKDAFEAFKSSGDIFNREVANRFRREILERGGGEDGAVMYRNYRGADPSRDPLLISRGVMEPPKPEVEEELTEEESEIIEKDEK